LRFAQRIYRAPGTDGGQLLLEANVRVACVDAHTLRPQRLPRFLTEALAAPGSSHG
jgi:acyl-CoA thioesterase FadM